MADIAELTEDDYALIERAASKAMREWERGYICQDVNVRHSIDWWVMKETERYVRDRRSQTVGWEPISTAPKDGTRFWGNVDDDAIAMLWHEGFGEFVSSWRRMEMASGYTIDGATFKDHHPVTHYPTHWMPIPHPPHQDTSLSPNPSEEGRA